MINVQTLTMMLPMMVPPMLLAMMMMPPMLLEVATLSQNGALEVP